MPKGLKKGSAAACRWERSEDRHGSTSVGARGPIRLCEDRIDLNLNEEERRLDRRVNNEEGTVAGTTCKECEKRRMPIRL